MERANVTKGVFANPIFPFMDLDDLCGDIEDELASMSLGAGFVSQLDKIDEISEHRMHLLSYINDVLFDISEYLDEPLFKGFNEAMNIMASIDMRDVKTDNTIGVQVDVSYTGRGAGYSHKSDLPHLTLEDFIGSRYEERTGNSYGYSTYNQKVEGFADLFEEDYENLINNDILNMEEKSLKEYLDSLILKEFPHKKDSPYYLELIQMVSEITVVIPFYEAAVGKTLFTNDYLTETEGNYKIVSGTVSLVTLGYGAFAAKGSSLAISKVLAAELVSEVAADATIITCERVGAPSAVTVALAIIAGSAAGIATNKALLKNHSVVDLDDVVGGVDQNIKSGSKTTDNIIEGTGAGVKSSLKTTEVTPPGSSHPVKVYTDGNAQINTGKIDTYMRGKVELDVDTVKSRINELKNIKKTNPEIFNKNMRSELKSIEDKLHNYQRSQEMSKTLNNAGILDNAENNQMIAEELLEAAKSAKTGNTEIISYIEGSNGNIQVVSRWKILDDGTPYLATVILKPIK